MSDSSELTLEDPAFTVTPDVPKVYARLTYFVRAGPAPAGAAGLPESVYFGALRAGSSVNSLLSLMTGVYVPSMLNDPSFPDAVRKDLTSQLHKFMANLTETRHEVEGRTVLYIPRQALPDVLAAAADRDLVHRLESTILHWTRQIKEVLHRQDDSNPDDADGAGPLGEIEFWRARKVDMGGIRTQLEDPDLRGVLQVLELAKSTYLAPFLDLRTTISQEALAAEDNWQFLLCLEAPCTQLHAAAPTQIPELLPHILSCVRMIWNVSRFYNTPERITMLLRKLSNEIISLCCSVVSLEDIFAGDVPAVMGRLQECMVAAARWKELYAVTAAAVKRHSKKAWDFETSSIFAQVDAFIQRCRDLLEVCDAQLQFSERAVVPRFSGSRAADIDKSIADIQASFAGVLGDLVRLSRTYNMLDVKATRWYDDFSTFKNGCATWRSCS